MHVAELNHQVTKQAKDLLINLQFWLKHLPVSEKNKDQYNIAFNSVHKALLDTRLYQKILDEGQQRNPEHENSLSTLWADASFQIRPFHSELADLCMVKGHGWADSKVWNMHEYKNLPIEIDQMLLHIMKLSQGDITKELEEQKRRERRLAFTFGVVFVTVILILAIFFPKPTPFQYDVFKIVLALAAAGVAVEIPGFLKVKVHKFVRAGGAIAVFVIVFFFSPAQLAVKELPDQDAVNINHGANSSLQKVIRITEKTQKVIIVFNPNCTDEVKNAIVETNGKQLYGANVKDFIEKLKNRIRAPIKYTVNEISKNERYEITCH